MTKKKTQKIKGSAQNVNNINSLGNTNTISQKADNSKKKEEKTNGKKVVNEGQVETWRIRSRSKIKIQYKKCIEIKKLKN